MVPTIIVFALAGIVCGAAIIYMARIVRALKQGRTYASGLFVSLTQANRRFFSGLLMICVIIILCLLVLLRDAIAGVAILYVALTLFLIIGSLWLGIMAWADVRELKTSRALRDHLVRELRDSNRESDEETSGAGGSDA